MWVASTPKEFLGDQNLQSCQETKGVMQEWQKRMTASFLEEVIQS